MKSSAGITGILVAIGIGIGFLVGRGTAPEPEGGKSGDGKDRAERREGGLVGSGGEHGTAREGVQRSGRRSAAASIRRVAQELELSPMINMDFDGLFAAYEAIRWMSPSEVEIALNELEEATSNQQVKMMLQMMLINQWAKADGRGAVEFAMGQKTPMLKMMGVMGGLMGWVKEDPDEAYDWYQKNRDEVKGGLLGRSGMDGIFFAALAQRDMKDAFSRLEELDRSAKEDALNSMASQLGMNSVKREEFLLELEKLDDQELSTAALSSMVQMWVYQDPEGAMEFYESREWGNDSDLRDQLVRGWAQMDAEGALMWSLDNLEDEGERAEVVADGFAGWMTQDPDAARKWLEGQPVELRTDSLYEQTAQQLSYQDEYQQAIDWASQIEDRDSRVESLENVYSMWKSDDSEEAQKWLERQDEATRAALENNEAEEVEPE